MARVTQISLPPLLVEICSIKNVAEVANKLTNIQSTNQPVNKLGSKVNIGMFAHEFVSNNNITPPNTTNEYTVQMTPDQFKCISCLLPALPSPSQSFCVSEQKGGATVLKQQTAFLCKEGDICGLAPAMSVKVLFLSNQEIQLQPGSQIPTITPARVTHMFTVCVPLSQLLPQLSTQGGCIVQVVTSEDNNTKWQLHLSLADQNWVQQQDFQNSICEQLDLIKAHESLMELRMGRPCETLLQLVTGLTNAREERKQACNAVLKRFTDAEMPVTWELQMSRSLGPTVKTNEKGESILEPAKIC